MTTYSIVHVPFTIGQRYWYEKDTGLDFDEAKTRLTARAEAIRKELPDCVLTWINTCRFEVTDDTAVIMHDALGNTMIVEEETVDD